MTHTGRVPAQKKRRSLQTRNKIRTKKKWKQKKRYTQNGEKPWRCVEHIQSRDVPMIIITRIPPNRRRHETDEKIKPNSNEFHNKWQRIIIIFHHLMSAKRKLRWRSGRGCSMKNRSDEKGNNEISLHLCGCYHWNNKHNISTTKNFLSVCLSKLFACARRATFNEMQIFNRFSIFDILFSLVFWVFGFRFLLFAVYIAFTRSFKRNAPFEHFSNCCFYLFR